MVVFLKSKLSIPSCSQCMRSITLDLPTVPPTLIDQLQLNHSYAKWRCGSDGAYSNGVYFDSRSPQWVALLHLLYSSTLATADFVVEFFSADTDSSDFAPFHLIENPRVYPDAFSAIKGWPWFRKVESEDRRCTSFRVGSLRSSLPFILGLFQDPPCDTQEDRYPPGCIVTRMSIRVANLVIVVDVYRASEPLIVREFH